MLMYPHLNPVALSLGPIKVHWYGLMYLFGFLSFIYLGRLRLKYKPHPFLSAKSLDDILFYAALGVIIGGRVGYCLFYQPSYYLSYPLNIIKTWDGGMSFHGGMLGVFIAFYLYARKINRSFFEISDFCALFVPLCLFFGRLGNFINGELWGRLCSQNLPWGMVFPQSGIMLPRHPSQIYEALCEGILMMVILWIYASKPRRIGEVSAIFMIGYGIIRFCLEFFREPDSFATGIVAKTGLSLGQFYSIPMILAGIIIFIWAIGNKKYPCKIII